MRQQTHPPTSPNLSSDPLPLRLQINGKILTAIPAPSHEPKFHFLLVGGLGREGRQERANGFKACSKKWADVISFSISHLSLCWVCLRVTVLLSGLAEKRIVSAKRQKKAGSVEEVGKSHTAGNETLTPKPKTKGAGGQRAKHYKGPRNDLGCTDMGGICQPSRYVCQGHYVKNKCAGAKIRQCCMPGSGAWSVLCSGHHNNRIRACDVFGCGAFNSNRGDGLHKAVDVVCEDYGIINAPFSGTLAGLVGRAGPDGMQYDGVKILNSEHCVKLFNIRPYRFMGPVRQGEELGYLLPLQDRFSGITSHMELQMCDGSDPSPFI